VQEAGDVAVTIGGCPALTEWVLAVAGGGWGSLRYQVLPPLPRYEFDSAYIQRLIDEDPETERHFTRYFGELLSLKLRTRLRSPSLVEDARQETFVRVLTSLKQKGGLDTAASLGAFVNAVCNNVVLEMYRAGRRTEPLDEAIDPADERQADAETRVLRDEDRFRVRRALAALPEKERELLSWLFFDERDKDSICRTLNVDRNYLRVLLHRAKARFREQLAAGVMD
jgi:RNA polymerase sigma-70 factor, ECF subfamily